MADIALSTSSTTPQAVGAHVVYLKESLSDEWTEVPALHCDSVQFSAAPSFSTAKLYWRYGVGKLPAELAFDTITRQSVNRYYVLIDLTEMTTNGATLAFFGTVEIDADKIDGSSSGRQSLECYGIERLLDLRPIRSSYYVSHVAGETSRESGAALVFNAGGQPNRSNTRESGAFLFALPTAEAEYWTSADIAEYLLARHAGVEVGGEVGTVEWSLDDESAVTPSWDQPVIDPHGRTIWEILLQLYPRQRMLSFITRLADDGETLTIRPFTFAQEAIDLGDDATIEPCPTQHTLSVAGDHTASVMFTASTLDVCDRVVCEGAPRTSTATLTIDEHLIGSWTEGMRDDYNAAASDDGDYPADTEPAERARRNIDARNAVALATVFSRFILSEDFRKTQKIDTNPVFPDDDDETVAHLAAPQLLTILPELTLLTDHDYTFDAIEIDEVATATTGPYARRQPLVLTPLPDDPETDPDLRKWIDVTLVGQTAGEEEDSDETNRRWSARVDVLPPSSDGVAAVMLRVEDQPQHVIAALDFEPLTPLEEHGERDIAKFDYEEFTFTLTLQEDRRATGQWPTGNLDVEIPRVKFISVGDKYRCDYVVPDTVVSTDPASCVRQKSDGGYLRDDRPLLEKIARQAYAWYGTQRTSVNLQSSLIEPRLIPGVLLTTVAGRTVNSCVTGLNIEIPRASGSQVGVPKATYVTQFGELDPLASVPM